MAISRCFCPVPALQSREGVCLMAYKALPIPWMGPGLTAGLGGPTRPRRDAERYRYRRHACASVVLACIACVPQHMKRLRADFRTPATRRECRAAVAADAMTARGTAAAAASAVVAADAVSPPSAAVHVVAARASCAQFARRGWDRHEGRSPCPRVSWVIGSGAAASMSSRGALPWATTRPMHVVHCRPEVPRRCFRVFRPLRVRYMSVSWSRKLILGVLEPSHKCSCTWCWFPVR